MEIECPRFYVMLMVNGQSPSGLAGSASSPHSGEPFCAGLTREKAAPHSGEVVERQR